MGGPPSGQPGAAPGVQVVLDEREMRTIFSNAYRIHTTAEEVVVDFGFNMANPNPQGGQQQQLLFKVTDRVIMSYPNVKRLAAVAPAARPPLRAAVRRDPDAARARSPARSVDARPRRAGLVTIDRKSRGRRRVAERVRLRSDGLASVRDLARSFVAFGGITPPRSTRGYRVVRRPQVRRAVAPRRRGRLPSCCTSIAAAIEPRNAAACSDPPAASVRLAAASSASPQPRGSTRAVRQGGEVFAAQPLAGVRGRCGRT